ncbi:hypothetical protein SADFL11_3032 [Roseibium alexandrii DFL-11]|uniref:Uncharacterized protein n=1 Tax=Roseibium alexandrii (strain DSM 17067 / NCIMB 14079 / DFL-11) TaxID=244592 RepID=A0A5E8H1D4_ROSAD|nr:hypothetical protein SADFL11_3032 [Roseibium alexandrii DFL-11]
MKGQLFDAKDLNPIEMSATIAAPPPADGAHTSGIANAYRLVSDFF